jgi:hypothetical protein
VARDSRPYVSSPDAEIAAIRRPLAYHWEFCGIKTDLGALKQITGYAMMKGWQVADFFIEAGVSGSVPLTERPEGRRLVEPARGT